MAKLAMIVQNERLADEDENPNDVEPWTKAKDDILRELCFYRH